MAGGATPTSSAGHPSAGANTTSKLTFKSDHQSGAGHAFDLLNGPEVRTNKELTVRADGPGTTTAHPDTGRDSAQYTVVLAQLLGLPTSPADRVRATDNQTGRTYR